MRFRRKKNISKKLRIHKKPHFKAPNDAKLFGIVAEIYLDDEQKLLASKLLGCGRLVYNKCLAFNNYWYGLYKEALKKNEEQPDAVPAEEIKRYKDNCSIYILSDVFESLKTLDEYSFLT